MTAFVQNIARVYESEKGRLVLDNVISMVYYDFLASTVHGGEFCSKPKNSNEGSGLPVKFLYCMLLLVVKNCLIF